MPTREGPQGQIASTSSKTVEAERWGAAQVEPRWERSSVIGGLAQICIGLAFAVGSLGLRIGEASRMGPGYFPLILSVLLILLGLATILAARSRSGSGSGWGEIRIAWRPVFFVLAAIVAFGFTLERIGFLPAIALVVALSRFAERRMSWKGLIGLVALMVFLSWLVFVQFLGMPLRLWRMPF